MKVPGTSEKNFFIHISPPPIRGIGGLPGALLEIEAHMRRVDHYFKLPLLKKVIKEEIMKNLKEQKTNLEPPQEFQLKMA